SENVLRSQSQATWPRDRRELAPRMRCSRCAKKAAEVTAVARPRPRGVLKNPDTFATRGVDQQSSRISPTRHAGITAISLDEIVVREIGIAYFGHGICDRIVNASTPVRPIVSEGDIWSGAAYRARGIADARVKSHRSLSIPQIQICERHLQGTLCHMAPV